MSTDLLDYPAAVLPAETETDGSEKRILRFFSNVLRWSHSAFSLEIACEM